MAILMLPVRDKRSVIIGTLLGDSSLYKGKKSVNWTLNFTHSIKQREYAEYKANFINGMLFGEKAKVYYSQASCNGKKYSIVIYRSRVNRYFNYIRKLLYVDRRKRITTKVLRYLTPIGVAFWYMDDGWKVVRRRKNGTIKQRVTGISTGGFTLEENNLIVEYFRDAYDVNFNIYRTGRDGKYLEIKCGVQEAIKLHRIILPYIHESMHYKIFKELLYHSAGHPARDDDIVLSV